MLDECVDFVVRDDFGALIAGARPVEQVNCWGRTRIDLGSSVRDKAECKFAE